MVLETTTTKKKKRKKTIQINAMLEMKDIKTFKTIPPIYRAMG